MDSVETYLADILAAIRPLPPRELALSDALGAVLTDDVTARYPLPSFDNSAMDGYAVRAADVATASDESPAVLPVDGEIAAGDTGRRDLVPGSVIRIMTGAPMPAGADAVVQVELTDGGTEWVAIHQAVEAGQAVRLTGGDAQPGDLLLTAGTRLGAVHLGLLAAAGHGSVRARPRPRVTVISTGNELVEAGRRADPRPDLGIERDDAGRRGPRGGLPGAPLPDRPRHHRRGACRRAGRAGGRRPAGHNGGVSMGGEHDVVKAALAALGTVTFRKVAMQPGMPQGFGTVGPAATPIFTLPGNPVSAYVSFCLFVRPALDALQDSYRERAKPGQAVLAGPVRSPAEKRSFLRGVLDAPAGLVTPVSGQASHQLASLARANALIIVPEHITSLDAGETVEVLGLP